MLTSPDRCVALRLATTSLVAMALLAVLVVATPRDSAATGDVPMIIITKTVVGDPSPESFQFTVSPEVDGCSAEQTVTIDGAGGQVMVPLIDAVAGPVSFGADDFTTTTVFGGVEDFDFTFDLMQITRGDSYVSAPFGTIDYQVFGTLSGTPSGFDAFNLQRDIPFSDFVMQQSGYGFATTGDADLSDGLQVNELIGTDLVFVLDAKEIGTGRYHPPLVELRADGTGRIQNSRNSGGINPATMQEVDVDLGDEYITDLAFDPAALTLAPGVVCTYTVTETMAAGFTTDTPTLVGLATGDPADFVNTAVPVLCQGKVVTIDMRTNGGNGVGTAGSDVIQGTLGDDVIDAGAGSDTVCAGAGNDVVVGGDGDDMLFGGEGNDILRGNAGEDLLSGQAGNDRVLGGTGADVMNGGDGDDYLGGFGGADTISGGPGNERIFGGFGADVIDGGSGDDVIRGLIGDDTINGGGGNDQLDGDRGNDTINGGPGDDTIRGGNANDILNGGAGDDDVSGGKADDTLSGGDGEGDVCSGNKQNAGGDRADSTCELIFGVP